MVLHAITHLIATISSLPGYAVLLDRFMRMLVVVIGLLPAAVCQILIFQCSAVALFER